MKRLWKIFKGFLLIWGAVSFVLFLVSGGCIVYSIMPNLGNRPTNTLASNKDVRFVLNWCNLGADRIEEVVHSYASASSFTGDHVGGHAIRVTHLDASELVYNEGRGGGGWHRGDALSGVAKDAVDFAILCLTTKEMPWFPTSDELRSPAMYVHIWSVKYAGMRPNSVQVIFANPDTKMVYYLSGKI